MTNYRTWATISLNQIAANYHALAAEAGPGVTVAAVVKADAYRHGAERVAQKLEAAGAKWMAVSNAAEGVALRDAGIQAQILVMGDFLAFEREALAASRLTPVVHSLAKLMDLDQWASQQDVHIDVHLKLDTGMGRLGTRATAEQIADAVRHLKNVRLQGFMTHFASATDFETTQTADQIMAFDGTIASLKNAGVELPLMHLSSSAPVIYGMKRTYGTMVRPGLGLYGYVSPPNGPSPAIAAVVKPALTWQARIVEIKEYQPGTPVGYSARWRAPRQSRVAVLAAGYADGLPHQLSTKGHVIVHGHRAPMVGAISMDLTTVDVTDVPQARPGDAVTLIGTEGNTKYDAQDMAAEAGIISYAVLCGIGNRVRRVYED